MAASKSRIGDPDVKLGGPSSRSTCPVLVEKSLADWTRSSERVMNHVLRAIQGSYLHPLAVFGDFVDEANSPATKQYLNLINSSEDLQRQYLFYRADTSIVFVDNTNRQVLTVGQFCGTPYQENDLVIPVDGDEHDYRVNPQYVQWLRNGQFPSQSDLEALRGFQEGNIHGKATPFSDVCRVIVELRWAIFKQVMATMRETIFSFDPSTIRLTINNTPIVAGPMGYQLTLSHLREILNRGKVNDISQRLAFIMEYFEMHVSQDRPEMQAQDDRTLRVGAPSSAMDEAEYARRLQFWDRVHSLNGPTRAQRTELDDHLSKALRDKGFEWEMLSQTRRRKLRENASQTDVPTAITAFEAHMKVSSKLGRSLSSQGKPKLPFISKQVLAENNINVGQYTRLRNWHNAQNTSAETMPAVDAVKYAKANKYRFAEPTRESQPTPRANQKKRSVGVAMSSSSDTPSAQRFSFLYMGTSPDIMVSSTYSVQVDDIPSMVVDSPTVTQLGNHVLLFDPNNETSPLHAFVDSGALAGSLIDVNLAHRLKERCSYYRQFKESEFIQLNGAAIGTLHVVGYMGFYLYMTVEQTPTDPFYLTFRVVSGLHPSAPRIVIGLPDFPLLGGLSTTAILQSFGYRPITTIRTMNVKGVRVPREVKDEDNPLTFVSSSVNESDFQ